MKRLTPFLILLSSMQLFQSCDNSKSGVSDNTGQDTVRNSDFFRKYSINEQQEDLKILKESLVKLHPDLYWHVTREEFEREFYTLLNGIKDDKTSYQFAFYIRDLFATIRCTHTGIIGLAEEQEEFRKNNLPGFPFNVKVIGNKLYIKDNFTDDNLFDTGSEIIAINDVKTVSLLTEYAKKVHVDGFNETAIVSRIGRHFKMLTEFKFNFPSSYNLEVRSPKGSVVKKAVAALGQSEIDEKYNRKYPPKESPSLKIIDSLKTAILTFDTFDDGTSRTFLAPGFKKIKDNGIQNLIIDVRKNGGGDDLYGSNLYAFIAEKPYEYYEHLEMRIDSLNEPVLKYGYLDTAGIKGYVGTNYLKKMANGNYIVDRGQHPILAEAPLQPDENSFKGRVFILTSYLTSSGGSEFCGIARNLKRATFIGQETGGGYCGNTSGKIFVLSLPNTKIRVWIPLMRYYAAIENCQGQGGIKPDYEITPSMDDLDASSDREMKTAFDLIRKQH